MPPRPSSFEQIADLIRQTRGRLRARACLIAAAWALVALVAVSAAVVITGAFIAQGGGLRAGAIVALSVALLVVSVRFLWRPWRQWRGDDAVAEHLEQGVPTLRDGLRASIQFGAQWGQSDDDPQMVAALADSVVAELGQRDLRPVTPMAPAKRPWMIASGALVAALTLALVFPGVVRKGFAALAPSPEIDGAKVTGPLVGDLTIKLIYPDYTGRPDRLIPNTSGDFEAPKGTRVQVSATTLAPAQAVFIRFGELPQEGEDATDDAAETPETSEADEGATDDSQKSAVGAEIPLTLSEGRDATGEFVVTEAGRWRFTVVDAKGDSLVEGVKRRIKLEADREPHVELKLPEADMEIDDLQSFPVVWSANDDFGMTKANVVLSLAADPEHPEKIPQPRVAGTRVRGEDEVDLSVIQAQPGDRIALTVEVFDNNTVDGPQRGVSVTRYITINSPEAKHFEISDKLRALVDQFVDVLADRLEVDLQAPGEVPVPGRVDALIGVTTAAANALGDLLSEMVDDPLTPKEVRLALLGRLGELEKAVDLEQQVLAQQRDALEQQAAPAVRRQAKKNEQVIDKVEQTILLLEAMVARLAIEDLMAIKDRIQADKENLRQLIEEYKKNPDDQLKARIMREIQRLKQRIDEMRARMAQMRQKLPEEFLNLDGLKNDEMTDGLKDSKDALSEMEKMLEEGNIEDALKALEEMTQALDDITKALDQDFQELHSETNPEMQRAINELMDQTRDLMKQQEKIQQETDEAAKAQAEAQRKLLEEQMKAQMDRIKQRAKRLEELAKDIDGRRMPSYQQEDLNALRQRADDLKGALDREALMEALEMAERSADHLDTLERLERNRGPMNTEGNKSKIMQGKGVNELIIQDLSEILEQAQRMAQQSQDQEQMQQMSQRQQRLGQQAQRLQQRIQRRRQQAPSMPGDAEERAQRAGDAMRRAGQRLGQGKPRQAQSEQQQAMNELKGLMKDMQQSLKPQRAERPGQQQQQGRRGTRNDKVRIPGADEYQAPAEFRQELLEAMKDRAPEAYEEQVRRYYESLVQ
ncbi:MAG: hypothetical protein ACE366_31595 [Bradymonadia bacterium]